MINKMERQKRLSVISVSSSGKIKNREPNFREHSRKEEIKRNMGNLASFERGVKKAILEFKKATGYNGKTTKS